MTRKMGTRDARGRHQIIVAQLAVVELLERRGRLCGARDQWARRSRSTGVFLIRNSLAGLVDLSQTTSTGPSLQRAIAFAAGIFYPPPPPTAAPGVDRLDRHTLEFLLPWLSLSTQFA